MNFYGTLALVIKTRLFFRYLGNLVTEEFSVMVKGVLNGKPRKFAYVHFWLLRNLNFLLWGPILIVGCVIHFAP